MNYKLNETKRKGEIKMKIDFEAFVEVGDNEYRINIIAEKGEASINRAWLQHNDRSEDLMEVGYDVISMIEDKINLYEIVNEEYETYFDER